MTLKLIYSQVVIFKGEKYVIFFVELENEMDAFACIKGKDLLQKRINLESSRKHKVISY